MRAFFLAPLARFARPIANSGHHQKALELAERQPDKAMPVTATNVDDGVTTIAATTTFVAIVGRSAEDWYLPRIAMACWKEA